MIPMLLDATLTGNPSCAVYLNLDTVMPHFPHIKDIKFPNERKLMRSFPRESGFDQQRLSVQALIKGSLVAAVHENFPMTSLQ